MKGMYSSLTLVKKLVLSTAIVLSIMLVFGISTVKKFSRVSHEQHFVADEVQPTLIEAEKLTEDTLNAGMSIGFYMLDKSEHNLSSYNNRIASAESRVEAMHKRKLVVEYPDLHKRVVEISKQIRKLKSYKPEIVNIATNTSENIVASKFANETLYPVAIDISQIMTEMILAEEGEDATGSRKKILADLNNLRYMWANMLNEMRLLLAFRTENSKKNLQLYEESVDEQLERVKAWKDELLFEQEIGLEQITEKFKFYKTNVIELIRIHESDMWRMDSWVVKNKLEPTIKLMQTNIAELLKELADISDNTTTSVEQTIDNGINETMISIVVSMLVMSLLAWMLTVTIRSQLGADPTQLLTITEAIAKGDLNSELNVSVPKGVYASVLVMQNNLRENIDKERTVAAENGRVRNALDNVSTNVIISDENFDIIYMNKSATTMFTKHEQEIRTDKPEFSATTLTGRSIDTIYHCEEEVVQELKSQNSMVVKNYTIGGRILRATFNPIFSEGRERRGTVVELLDRTDEAEIEREIQDIVDGALAGDLEMRISLSDKDGFIGRLSDGINRLVGVSDQVIGETVKVISALSKGDLTKAINGEYKGDYRRLKSDVNATIEKLTEVMCEISESAKMVFDSSTEMAEGNTSLSDRTEKQAANLEETASSMLQMTATVRNNASNANNANEIASGARSQAEDGAKVVNRAVTAMQEITESSNKISAIIGVIDEIAFQTNLLALNAAVEAARAGEQGRGFAVVAIEVRNLAGRSAVAAKEIKTLIDENVLKIEDGSKLVDDSGRTLEEIKDSVNKVSDIVSEIAAASMEQSEGIELVTKAISQMDEMTQKNAALVEEAAASSESMGEQAKSLNDLVGFFIIEGQNNHVSPEKTRVDPERRKANRPWEDVDNGSSILQPKVINNYETKANDEHSDGWAEF